MAANEQFCDNPAPQDSSCTCKQMRRRSIYTKTKDDTTSYLINKIRDRKRKNMIRTPGDIERKLDYDKFRGIVKELRENYKNGIISQESFLKWLNAADESNITPDFVHERIQ